MKFTPSILALTTLLVSAPILAQNKGMKVIYGEDNRLDVFESTNSAYVELAKSTAAMIDGGSLKLLNNEEIEINATTLQGRGICAHERFSKQITAANCSGFLVAPNVLVTAGHCIRTAADCRNWKWVFDFKVDFAEQGKIVIPSESVYSCKKVISQSLSSVTKDDYAVIELDRKVTDREPLKFRKAGKISKGAPLVVIGHPTGLPTKIADGANVRSLETKYFVANLDTYGGNSGSAVFNAKTHEVEGILVRGDTDYVYNRTYGCQVSNVCQNDSCRGEDVTYITNIDALKKL